ncbi:MAG: 6-hydroxymethylpterin diphosphokinase MptE-like protein [Candidatus Heimdallarchaeota archaeon]
MDWKTWKTEYQYIVQELGLDLQSDLYCAHQLEEILLKHASNREKTISDKLIAILQYPIIIAGAGPSLERDFELLMITKGLRKFWLISADGATSLLKKKSLVPQVVLTDLDGDPAAIEWAMKNGSIILIHAHGDNIHLVKSFCEVYGPEFSNYFVWGTTQTYPERLWNFGGFTDGDRAICLAMHFQSPLIALIGFDFGNQIGKYSIYNSPLQKSTSHKIRKFEVALRIISSSYSNHKGLRYNLTEKGEEIPGFTRIPVNRFWQEWDRLV